MILSIIAAMSENRVIGRAGDLPWRLPDEMRYFMNTTRGHTVISGRRTFESFGKPLPDRRNIVISRDPTFSPDGVEAATSLDAAIDLARHDDELFIAGGGQVYPLALPRADRLYLTVVHARLEGDTFFPEFDPHAWRLVSEQHHPADDRHDYAFTMYRYHRAAPGPAASADTA